MEGSAVPAKQHKGEWGSFMQSSSCPSLFLPPTSVPPPLTLPPYTPPCPTSLPPLLPPLTLPPYPPPFPTPNPTPCPYPTLPSPATASRLTRLASKPTEAATAAKGKGRGKAKAKAQEDAEEGEEGTAASHAAAVEPLASVPGCSNSTLPPSPIPLMGLIRQLLQCCTLCWGGGGGGGLSSAAQQACDGLMWLFFHAGLLHAAYMFMHLALGTDLQKQHLLAHSSRGGPGSGSGIGSQNDASADKPTVAHEHLKVGVCRVAVRVCGGGGAGAGWLGCHASAWQGRDAEIIITV